MKRLLLAGLGLLLVNSAQAADWKFVVQGGPILVYVDQASMKTQGKLVKFWEKMIFTNHQSLNGRVYAYSISLLYANCGDESTYLKKTTMYGANGEGIETDGPLPVKFVPVTPESNGEHELNFVCHAVKPSAAHHKAH